MVYDIGPVGLFILKASIIFIFTAINLRGLGDVGLASTIFSIMGLVAFALVAIVGFLKQLSNTRQKIITVEFRLVLVLIRQYLLPD
jgi:hypothetical protein